MTMTKTATKTVDSGINVVPLPTPYDLALRFAREQGRVEGAVETARLAAFEQFGRDISAGILKPHHAGAFWKSFAEGRNDANVTKKPLPIEGRKAESYISKLRMFASPSVLAAGDTWRNAVLSSYEHIDAKTRRAPFDAMYSAHCMLTQRCKDESADTDEARVAVMESISETAIRNAVSKDKGEPKAVHEDLLAMLSKAEKLLNPGENATDHIDEWEREGRVNVGDYRKAFEDIHSALEKLARRVSDDIQAANA